MKITSTLITAVLCAAAVLTAAPAPAADHSMHGASMGSMAEATFPGMRIGEQKVDGYMLTWRLLDRKERDAAMKGMEGMEMPGMSSSPDVTHHLMVFIKGSDGKYASGTVGFALTGPDGGSQKTMTMGMAGGYGADVILKAGGKYTVKMKAVIGEKTLTDDFSFEKK